MKLITLLTVFFFTVINAHADMIGVPLAQDLKEEEKTFLTQLYPEFEAFLANHPLEAKVVGRKVIAIHKDRSGNGTASEPTGRATSPEASLDLLAIMKLAAQKLQ